MWWGCKYLKLYYNNIHIIYNNRLVAKTLYKIKNGQYKYKKLKKKIKNIRYKNV